MVILHRYSVRQAGAGWLWMYIHDSVESLRQRTSILFGQNDTNSEAAWAGLRELRSAYLGQLHLKIDSSRLDVMHEAVHIGCTAMRRLGSKTIRLPPIKHSDPERDPEERLAYCASGFAVVIMAACESLGMFGLSD